MKNNKENNFAHKFRLLNSQESTHDINWSLSSSSDEETSLSNITYCKISNRHRYTKRKRRRKPTNVSNLEIEVLDNVSTCAGDRSPILCDKKSIQVSPILQSKLLRRSPILVPRNSRTSPISHQNVLKVNRNLFKGNHSPISTKINAHRTSCSEFIEEKSDNNDIKVEHQPIYETHSINAPNNEKKNSKHDIYRNVKRFIENTFTPDNSSQNSISDETTPKDSVKSEEIEIVSSPTDHESSSNGKIVMSANEKKHKDVVKKIRYRKGGHAYRLNALLKKHNASHSLWRHERFLAKNSNFVIPKEDHLVFRVRKVDCEYGCTLLNAVNENDENYCIVINNVYLNEKIGCDTIIKIYKPYKSIEMDGLKILYNVFKYDNMAVNIPE